MGGPQAAAAWRHHVPPMPAYVPPGGADPGAVQRRWARVCRCSRRWPRCRCPAALRFGAACRAPARAARGNRHTQHLSMSLELLALLGLRELAGSLVPGVPLETTGDVARLLTKMHDLVEMFCRCFVPLRDSRLGASRWARRMAGSKSASDVDHAADPATVASALLDWRNQDYDGPEAAERILADVVVQQAALLESLMRGVGSLLEEISPEAIEQAVREDAGMGRRVRALPRPVADVQGALRPRQPRRAPRRAAPRARDRGRLPEAAGAPARRRSVVR